MFNRNSSLVASRKGMSSLGKGNVIQYGKETRLLKDVLVEAFRLAGGISVDVVGGAREELEEEVEDNTRRENEARGD